MYAVEPQYPQGEFFPGHPADTEIHRGACIGPPDATKNYFQSHPEGNMRPSRHGSRTQVESNLWISNPQIRRAYLYTVPLLQ